MGPKHNSELSDRFLIQALPDIHTSYRLCDKRAASAKGKVAEMIQKSAIEEISPSKGFYSSLLFLVPKKDGGQWPVINLKALKHFVQKQYFKVDSIHDFKDLLMPKDWLAKVDLKDAFFTMPTYSNHKKYLRFVFQQWAYQFNRLPFYLCSAP